MTSTTDTVQPTPPDTTDVVVATRDGLFTPGSAPRFGGRSVTSVAADGPDLWVLVDGAELHRLGPAVDDAVAVLPSGSATCVHVHDGSVVVGGDEARLWTLGDGELVRSESFDQAPTRPEWHTPWGGPPAVLSMSSAGDDLYVGVHVGGILRSDDGTRSWTDTIDLHDDVHQVVAGADGTLWAATGRHGLATSTDRGRTWTHHVDGLHATYLLAVAVTSAGVLVGASSGHAGRDGALYLFDGTRFEQVRDGLPPRFDGAVGPRRIAGAGERAALATPDGTLHVSADGGRHWQAVERLPEPTEIVVRPAP